MEIGQPEVGLQHSRVNHKIVGAHFDVFIHTVNLNSLWFDHVLKTEF